MLDHPVSTTQKPNSDEPARAPSLFVIVDRVRTGSPEVFGLLSGWQWDCLRSKIARAGFLPSQVNIVLFREGMTVPNGVIITLGEGPLLYFTGKRGIDKWCLSPLPRIQGEGICIPTYDLGRIQVQYELGLFQELAFQRAFEYIANPPAPKRENFIMNPGVEETIERLKQIKNEEEIAVDVETGYGQINTIGFAWSPEDAIAINILPDRCDSLSYYELLRGIRSVMVSPSRKVFQNFIYDVSYLSAYGIATNNIHHDTMWAMKVLWPEFKSNLGNVGRFYTRRIYWKDDGKTADEEGKTKNWGNIRDWVKHYTYNMRDTTGTFEAAQEQKKDLAARGLTPFFTNYMMRLAEPILEMCSNGMPICLETKEKLQRETEERVKELMTEFRSVVGYDLNPRSPKQLLGYLKEQNVTLPKKYDKEKDAYKESTDAASIKKIRLKRPDLRSLALLQEIKSLETALSRYIDFDVRKDGRLSYSLNGAGTETLRFAGNKDAWDRGFNIQTIPREGGDVSIKQMFVAPEGFSFIEVDLRQAESRFVAYDAADKTLIDMLESGADVHTHVAKAILRELGRDPEAIPKEEFKGTWRQLGKKAGHGLNYAMKAKVFVETVFNELDIVIDKKTAESITRAYYGLFPGIPRWHQWIRQELYTKRKLTAPSGWQRYFYGRPGDDMHKEAYAWRPQHTIPWVTNHLMLYLIDERKQGNLKFHVLVQVHDSLILLVRDSEIESVAKACLAHKVWHPEVILPGGKMLIPTEVKFGKCMADLGEFECSGI